VSVAVSIVVPVHNRAALTRGCLDAVLAGLPADCELLVVDDASTDATPELLDGYRDSIRALRMAENGGYARACNEGARAAWGEALLFLNNDTLPEPGWLAAMRRHAGAERAAVVGARLLYPTGSIQHAGVVFGQDGYPHNLYAGLPAGFPPANRSRRLQAVTGACMLVERRAFEAAGGFDEGFLNSLEDVDLCLRIGERGGSVRYCPEAVLTHLESASRGRSERFEQSVDLYRRRWRETVRRDDLDVYVEDGLLGVEYPESFPLRLTVSPHLASIAADREPELEKLLGAYAGQVSNLLGEVVRLTGAVGGGELPGALGDAEPTGPTAGRERRGPGRRFLPALPERSRSERTATAQRREFLREVVRLEAEVRGLQERLAREEAEAADGPAAGADAFSANPRLGYGQLVEQVRTAVEETVPSGARVLVVSRGDRDLVDLDGRRGDHFPQDEGGAYLGHHPQDSLEAVDRLEALRAAGAEYLVLPSTAYWWLDHYAGFAEHLRLNYPAEERECCSIFRLREETPAAAEEVPA
jgi:GT2 family glycosyltransferase